MLYILYMYVCGGGNIIVGFQVIFDLWPLYTDKQNKAESEPKRRRGAVKASCSFSGYEKMMTMRDEVLASVRDIEQLVQHGRDAHTCPYYSTRLAIPAAQVHTHP